MPATSSEKRSSSRARIGRGGENPGSSRRELDRQREAVEHRQTAATSAAFARRGRICGPPGPRREQLNRLAARIRQRGAGRGGAERRTVHITSPAMPSARRLVASMPMPVRRQPGVSQARRMASRTCSQVSRTSESRPVGEPGSERARVGQLRQAEADGQRVRHVRRVRSPRRAPPAHGARLRRPGCARPRRRDGSCRRRPGPVSVTTRFLATMGSSSFGDLLLVVPTSREVDRGKAGGAFSAVGSDRRR